VIVKDGFSFDKDVSSDIRKFIMFKGDADLDVLRSSNALKIFVDNFSDVKAFDAYSAFMEYTTKKADQARDNAQKMDKKNEEAPAKETPKPNTPPEEDKIEQIRKRLTEKK
jgi:DNA sulfur modification protein DndD